MNRLICVSLLCLVFILSAASFSFAATADDYSFILNSLPLLGEKAEKLPDFIQVTPQDSGPCGSFYGQYADVAIQGHTWEGGICVLYITTPSNLDFAL